jgi:hypothetical protein
VVHDLGPRELAKAQTANGCEHRGDEPKPTEPRRGVVASYGDDGWPPPSPPWDGGVEPEPVKSASGVLRIGCAASWQNHVSTLVSAPIG